jgi:hypothetical protein
METAAGSASSLSSEDVIMEEEMVDKKITLPENKPESVLVSDEKLEIPNRNVDTDMKLAADVDIKVDKKLRSVSPVKPVSESKLPALNLLTSPNRTSDWSLTPPKEEDNSVDTGSGAGSANRPVVPANSPVTSGRNVLHSSIEILPPSKFFRSILTRDLFVTLFLFFQTSF